MADISARQLSSLPYMVKVEDDVLYAVAVGEEELGYVSLVHGLVELPDGRAFLSAVNSELGTSFVIWGDIEARTENPGRFVEETHGSLPRFYVRV